MTDHFIPPHGGYQDLLSCQKAEVVYDATVKFCAAFLDKRDRTADQMVQAARSGKQNIVEASMASGTSKEAEIKLTNVACASLEELLVDYRDFLRTRGLHLWEKDSKEALFVRKLGASHDVSYESYRAYLETRPPEVVANIIICLIHQTNYLLDRQIRQLERAFLQEVGLRERMTRARLAARAPNRSGRDELPPNHGIDKRISSACCRRPDLLPPPARRFDASGPSDAHLSYSSYPSYSPPTASLHAATKKVRGLPPGPCLLTPDQGALA